MNLVLPSGRRHMDLVSQRGGKYRFGGTRAVRGGVSSRTAQVGTAWIFLLLMGGAFFAVPASVPVKVLLVLAALLAVGVSASAWSRGGAFGSAAVIEIDAQAGVVRLPRSSAMGGDVPMGDLELWVHPARLSFPGESPLDRADLMSQEWWVSLVGDAGGGMQRRVFSMRLYGCGIRPDMEIAARRLLDLGGWGGLRIEHEGGR